MIHRKYIKVCVMLCVLIGISIWLVSALFTNDDIVSDSVIAFSRTTDDGNRFFWNIRTKTNNRICFDIAPSKGKFLSDCRSGNYWKSALIAEERSMIILELQIASPEKIIFRLYDDPKHKVMAGSYEFPLSLKRHQLKIDGLSGARDLKWRTGGAGPRILAEFQSIDAEEQYYGRLWIESQ